MGLWDAVTSLPADMAAALMEGFRQQLIAFIQPLLEAAKALITLNIDPFAFQDLWLAIVAIISAFYLLLFLIVGLKFLFGCYDAVHRKQAKEWFKNAVILVVAVNASLLLYSLLLNLGSAIALTLWSEELEAVFLVESLGALDLIWAGIFAVSLLLALLTLVIRQVFLILGVALFPIGVFLYFIPPLKAYGRVLLNLIGVAVFIQVLDVVVLIALQLFYGQFGELAGMALLAPSLGFAFIFLANTIAVFVAIHKALNDVGIKIDLVSTAAHLAGPALMAGV